MTPLERYRKDVADGLMIPDPAQESAMLALQRVYDDLLASQQPGQGGWWQRWLGRSRPAQVQGLYLYGGVGRGKTYLMDVFHECLPGERKMRTHFHRFMQRVHKYLGALQQQKNPLEQVADRLCKDAEVICFDEFFVSDIGDAMILANLLEHLLSRGVVLVATSNIPPEKLYENGLQRQRFLPAIDLICKHTQVHHMDSRTDYRLRELQQARLYHSPLGPEADGALEESFRRLAPAHAEARREVDLSVLGRKIRASRVADDVVWFEFAELCEGPRSANDYIELAREFHAVLLVNVPQLGKGREEAARRFVSLVDELYDRRVKLILSAAVPLHQLYAGGDLGFIFERTRSRLLEMQSEEYLASAHRA